MPFNDSRHRLAFPGRLTVARLSLHQRLLPLVSWARPFRRRSPLIALYQAISRTRRGPATHRTWRARADVGGVQGCLRSLISNPANPLHKRVSAHEAEGEGFEPSIRL